MSKGSDTSKRTNFKKFSEGYDKIDWSTKKEIAPDLPQDIVDQISAITARIEQVDKEIEQFHLDNEESQQNGTDNGED